MQDKDKKLITIADVKAQLVAHYAGDAIREKDIQADLATRKVLFVCSEAERVASSVLKNWCIKHRVLAKFIFRDLNTAQLAAAADNYKPRMVVVSNKHTFRHCGNMYKDGSQEVWRGSVLPRGYITGVQYPVLIIPHLVDATNRQKQHTVPSFLWQLEKDLSKVLYYTGEFDYRYQICVTKEEIDLFASYATSPKVKIVAADIETSLANYITSIAFTCIVEPEPGKLGIGATFVLDWTNMRSFANVYSACKVVLEWPETIKCFHNGCFDTAFLFIWRIAVVNWLFDTEYLWACYEAEAKKSLAYVASIVLPDYIYWKAESKTNMLEYNAKDTINTARILLWQLANLPKYAWHNYSQLLPVLIPTVVCNLEGFAVDPNRLEEVRARAVESYAKSLKKISEIIALPEETTLKILNSPKRLAHLLYAHLGPTFGWVRQVTSGAKKQARKTGKLPSGTDVTSLKQLAILHPFAARLVDEILQWRKVAKALSTYYYAHLYGDSQRLYYALQVDGTKSGRFSCSTSFLRLVTGTGPKGNVRASDIANYGSQIQNSPSYFKEILCADPGYAIFNIDKSKSEAHCVALISGDKAFNSAIQDPLEDFYLKLASWFFNVATVDKEHPIRQVTKKINHATSYCMAWETFLDQVGITKLYEYMRLVDWQGPKEPKTFINYLLNTLFHGTFPGIAKYWQRTTLELIRTKGYLTTPDGAVRHFFKVPSSPRSIYPAAVAHQPQRLSVVTLNRNMAQVFYEIQLPSKFAIRLKGQVHDSLVGQVADGQEHLVKEVHAIMERPYTTTLGVLKIPCDIEGPNFYWKPRKEKKVTDASAVIDTALVEEDSYVVS